MKTLTLLYSSLNIILVSAFESVRDASMYSPDHAVDNSNGVSHFKSLPINYNVTYIEKPDNTYRIPFEIKYDERKSKKRSSKKSPKRTIQKIIKKNRSRRKKTYFRQTRQTTFLPQKYDEDSSYVKEDHEQSIYNNEPTTQPPRNYKKAPKKWNSKLTRYPMPFHKMTGIKDRNHRRDKRDALKDNNVYILQDLDEVEFLGSADGNDVVNAHIQHHW